MKKARDYRISMGGNAVISIGHSSKLCAKIKDQLDQDPVYKPMPYRNNSKPWAP